MKKKYLYNGQIMQHSDVEDAARQSNLDVDSYIEKAGIKAIDDNYSLKGKNYTAEDILDAANQSKLNFDDYIQKAGFEKKSQDGNGLEVNGNGRLKPSVPTISQSQLGNNPFDIKESLSINKVDNIPIPTTLDEAHTQDKDKSKAVGKNIWNSLLLGIGDVSSGVGDLMFQGLQKILPDDPYSKGAEADLKKFREEGLPTIRTATKELVGAKVTSEQEKNFNDNFWTSAIGGLARTVPAMIGTKGTGFLFQAYDSGIQTINNTETGKDLPESSKTIFGLGVGAAQAAIFKVGLDKIFGKQATKVATNLAVKTFSNLVKTSKAPITAEVFEAALSTAAKSLKSKIINGGIKVAKSAATGFLMGSAIEGSNELAKTITNKIEGNEIFEPTTWGEKFSGVLHAGTSTAVGGGILGMSSIPFSKSRNYIAEKVAGAKSLSDISNLKNELIAKSPEIHPDEANHLNMLIDDYVRVNSKVPDDIPNRKEVVEKIIEREEVENAAKEKEQQLETIDDAFKPDIQKEVDLLKEKAKELNSEITNPEKLKISESIQTAIDNADDVKTKVYKDVLQSGSKEDVSDLLKEVSDQWHDEGTRDATERNFGLQVVEAAKKLFPQESVKTLLPKEVTNKEVQPSIENKEVIPERTKEEIKKLTSEPIPIEQIQAGVKVEIKDFEKSGTKKVFATEARTELRNRLKQIEQIIKCI